MLQTIVLPQLGSGETAGFGEKKMTEPFEKCPVCGADLQEKEVEKLLRGGVNTAVVTVRAEVCLHCGERLYSPETVKRFEEIKAKLEGGETSDLHPIGGSFKVA